MSKKFIEWNVDQGLLFPARIGDFVSEDHLANFVREVVCEERVDYMAISGMKAPNFRTISKFKKTLE